MEKLILHASSELLLICMLQVIGKRNIWSLVANEHQNSPMADLDWAEMEGLFCQQVPPMVPPTTYSSTCTGVDAERRRREPTEVAFYLTFILQCEIIKVSYIFSTFRLRYLTEKEA